ncbi:hypothetical protein SESBI_21447 [Sesbania bispinosa]|nr:hypothetical protein SESBI_21447 [Sesbania bispinosa]
MDVKNRQSDSDSSDESLPQPTKQPSSTQTQTRPPSSRLRSGVLKPSTPFEPIHVDLIKERKSKKQEDPDHSRMNNKEKVGYSSAPSSDNHFMNKEDEEAFLTKFAKKTVLSEKIIDLNSLRNCGWDLYPYTNRQEIGSYFDREGFIYPKLVIAFYATSKEEITEDGSPWIRI